MLYTLAKANYDEETLNFFFSHLSENDAVVLWQDGVLQAVKNPQFFVKLPHCYLLEQDVQARGLQGKLATFHQIRLSDFVQLTEVYFPQIAI